MYLFSNLLFSSSSSYCLKILNGFIAKYYWLWVKYSWLRLIDNFLTNFDVLRNLTNQKNIDIFFFLLYLNLAPCVSYSSEFIFIFLITANEQKRFNQKKKQPVYFSLSLFILFRLDLSIYSICWLCNHASLYGIYNNDIKLSDFIFIQIKTIKRERENNNNNNSIHLVILNLSNRLYL